MWNKLLEIIKKNSIVPFATISEDSPVVRPMTLSVIGDKLYTHTKSDSKKVAQLEKNPSFSFYLTDSDGFIHFVFGKAVFCEDINEKREVFSGDDTFKTFFSSPEDKELSILRLWVKKYEWFNEEGEIECWLNQQFK